ncbi:putative conjugative transfer protein TraA [Orientia tsutsugamushi str. UT144]|uniref:Putative conjugative transfer protein TraA n=1 Tax=Orientia tsutsugamushi str. UT144 TaxID=1441384 RepID=A0A0F3RM88_ORITS|nr:hypothetical protein [Orientia tsutsugamushi]KJW06329.1 putative conjugative transfer protein TraA [Orientia tsutsugamushi str. UT144]
MKIINDADVITDSITHYKSIFTKQDVEKAVKDIPYSAEAESSWFSKCLVQIEY